ncbi:FHA domain-containing protein [Microlunatus speluncae]|uniref:FHA domain-containing protein n=1 Tax=Microlunatus speluncae TaxID=2594267 RepID=UPI00126675E4|nr:FHA domain-containing protein [Microlunatus speluncae]
MSNTAGSVRATYGGVEDHHSSSFGDQDSGQVSRWRAAYTPGDWVILSGPTSLVVLEPSSIRHGSLINTLWAEVMSSSSLADVAERLAGYRIDDMASFAAFFWSPDGMRSLVRGGISVMNLGNGKIVADGSGVQTWREVGLEDVEQVRIELAHDGDQTLLELPLVVGVVTASSITLDAGADAQVISPQAAPTQGAEDLGRQPDLESENADTEVMAAESAQQNYGYVDNGQEYGFDDQYADAQDWQQDEPDLEPTRRVNDQYREEEPYLSAAEAAGVYAEEPRGRRVASAPDADLMAGESLIMAVLCVQQHSNPPESISCRVCGDRVPHQNPRLVTRPALATLRGDNGAEADLDVPVVIGRAPSADRSTVENPRFLTVLSPGHDISRTHAQVEPDGWEIVVTDLHSTNGTAVVLGGPEIVRRRLAPGESMVVPLGSVLELGDGVSVAIDSPS